MRALFSSVIVAIVLMTAMDGARFEGWTMTVGAEAMSQPAQPLPQPAQEEFVPISEVPPSEQLPAARLLIAAYAFVWIAMMVYVWSIWRRMRRIETELQRVAERVGDQV